jgi:cell division protein FtsW
MFKFDLYLITLICLLYLIGSFIAYEITLANLDNISGGLNTFYKYLLLNIFFPILGFIFFSLIKWRIIKRLAPILLFLSMLFLILAFIPIFKLPGQTTARWFKLGFISFQPAEFIKFSALLFLAFLVPLFIKDKTYFWISIFIIGLISFLIFIQPALSNLIIFLVSISAGLLSVRYSNKYLLVLFMIMILIIGLSFSQEYRIKRILGIIKGDEKGIAFQLKQTRLAISSGGLFGKGLGNSEFKIIGIPLMLTDSIFAIYAEETGFIGSLILISLILLLVLRIFAKAHKITDEEKKFFCYGVGCWISIQAFIHIISNVFLTTGVPLPFISYGPSSQLAIMSALGIINNIENS